MPVPNPKTEILCYKKNLMASHRNYPPATPGTASPLSSKLSDIILSSVSIAKPHEHYLQLFNTCQNDCFSSDKHNYRTFFVDSTFAQFMNSRIQKLINSLTRGHTSKTEGGVPITR